MLFGWGLLIPLGTLAAVYGGPRFELGGPKYFDAHRALQSAGLFVGIVGLYDIISALYPNNFGKTFITGLPKHGYFGLVIMLLGILQPVNGIIRPSRTSKMRTNWEFLHKNIGRTLAIGGLVNCIM